MKKNKIKIVIVFIFMLISFLVSFVYLINSYKESVYSYETIMNNDNVKDFIIEDGYFISTSVDPWINLQFEKKQKVKIVDIYIKSISSKDNICTVFTGGENWIGSSGALSTGENSIYIKNSYDMLSYLRVDLVEKKDIRLKIDKIVLNDKKKIIFFSIKKAAIISLILSSILLIVYSSIDKTLQEKIKLLRKKYYNKNKTKEFSIFVLKCWIINCFGILTILKADFQYIDDLGRTMTGNVSDWDAYSRFFASVICKIFSLNHIVSDLSPLFQLLTMLLMAISFGIVVYSFFPKKINSNWMILASIPFALSPYFMQNISFKIESIIHGFTVLISVIPLLFIRKEYKGYFIVSTICILLMLLTYQGASGIYPCIIAFYALIELHENDNYKEILKRVFISILAYILAMIIFKCVFMSPISTHVSSDILPINKMFVGVIKNLIGFYKTIYEDFTIIWLLMTISCMLIFMYNYITTFKNGKKIYSIIYSIIGIILLCCLCFGIYPFLANCVYYPRAMFEFFIVISLLFIFCINNNSMLGKICLIILSYSFLVFSFEYGNCLNLQKEYTAVRMQSVIDYINTNYNSTEKYKLELDGDIQFAPAIRNQIKANPYLLKLIPKTFGGGWYWSDYKFINYYGIPENFRIIGTFDRNIENLDLLLEDMPLKAELMWFNVYEKDNKILIVLKN